MWIKQVSDTLVNLSENKADIKAALVEWFYSGVTYDLNEPAEDCELCGHQGIRYQFEILNSLNSNSLLIGSECITKFSIPAVDKNGVKLNKKLTKKIVSADKQKLIVAASKNRMINSLILLGANDMDIDVGKFISYFDERGAFTPKQLNLLIWKLKKAQIAYNPKDFKMTIKRLREREQLSYLKDYQLMNLLPSMSNSQKKYLKINKD